jgi:hypothetical protein
VIWNRFVFDMWLARVDVLQYYLPNYGFLGQQLRELNIPGWNPHQFAGQPFAADPQSGWMQLPIMTLFAFFDPVPAMKAFFAFNICLGLLSSYAYARVLGMGSPASMVAAIAFGFGSLIHFNTYCCTLLGSFAPWIPLVLLGIELALRTQSRIYRWAAIFLTGLALSQMLVSWLGQGTFFAFMLTGSYLVYRTIVSPPAGAGWTIRHRLLTLFTIGPAVMFSGLLLAAGGILPRLDVNRYTNLRGGDYEALGISSNIDWTYWMMLNIILDPAFVPRRYYFGTVVVMLAILAPIVARKRFAVSYFTVLTVVCLILSLGGSPLHDLFYVIPRFRSLHDHGEQRIMAIVLIGPAMLAAASIESLLHMRVRMRTIALAFVPALAYARFWLFFNAEPGSLPRHVWVLVPTFTLLLAVYLLLRVDRDWRLLRSGRPLAVVIPFLVLALLLLDLAGKDIIESLRGQSTSRTYQVLLDDRDDREARIRVFTNCKDRDGAGGFLAQQLDASAEPFRYFGYEPSKIRYRGHFGTSYQSQVDSPLMRSLLVGSRAVCLGLDDVQGYNPVQLQRYVEFLRQINGVVLDYHDGAILQFGIDSPLLRLLNPRYIIIPSAIQPHDSQVGITPLRSTMPEVFDNGIVRVLENADAMPRAWMVHDVRQMPKDEILEALDSSAIDPRQTALVETSPPLIESDRVQIEDSVRFVTYEPDRIAMDVTAAGDGMLVLSESYVPGWNAYVDGKKSKIYATDYLLRGVALRAGERHVELRYEPASLRYGVWITLATGLVMLVVFAIAGWRWFRERRV